MQCPRFTGNLKYSMEGFPLCPEFCTALGIPKRKMDRLLDKKWWRMFLRSQGDKQNWAGDVLTKSHCINDYLNLKTHLRRKPTYREYYQVTHHGEVSLCKYFVKPGWRYMLAEIGDTLQAPMSKDKQFYIDAYLQCKNKLGRQPTVQSFVEEYGFSHPAFVQVLRSILVKNLGRNFSSLPAKTNHSKGIED